jgi:hypothetical protein
MGLDSCGCEAVAESVVFLRCFEDLPDPRQRAKVMYPLPEVLLLCLLAVLAGAETVTDIARFGNAKLALLRRFRPFAEGTPAHDHLGDILAALDAECFQRCFAAWAASLAGVPEGVVAIDGKTTTAKRYYLSSAKLSAEQFDILAQGALIALEGQHIVGLGVDDLAGDVALAADGVDGHDGAFDGQQVEQPGDGDDLVGLVGDLDLAEHEALPRGAIFVHCTTICCNAA